MDSRHLALTRWVADQLKVSDVHLEMVSGDASFRRYWRCQAHHQNWIVMDAPPEKEDSHSFVAIDHYWFENGIEVPKIHHFDLEQGFLILSDQGDQLLLTVLNPDQPDSTQGDRYYGSAIKTLLKIQSLDADSEYALPTYDEPLLRREMALFPDWLLSQKLALDLSDVEKKMLQSAFDCLVKSALSQVQVPVHRDYHARNLMVLSDEGLGVLDFQDAVHGPITYDLVSLLRDCYIVWPDAELERWRREYFDQAAKQGLLPEVSYETFTRWFDLMGIQRHLKAAGIFARLSIRDGKHGYLDDIPRTVEYIIRVGQAYPELKELVAWLNERVRPKLSSLDQS